ncbi:hypothetical protein M413DRAFT_315064 [Hebeloma cylindrosporum]|uniref:Btz domain-containing protein n=1 Tax=Hebeloma cylindrosporum TaxID=76867 RepID=A0A0C3CRB2_HEBCY|nr:hypothetical protein M413DRAFT_315064 [Hebeloma cylindrosporum h7]
MPAAVISQSSTRTVPQVATHKPRAATALPKKRRVIRRRGRARGELDSDEEIEREAATDSDSDDDDLSSSGSATDDSDTEPASEDVIPHDRAHLPTPRNSQSPESVIEGEPSKMNGVASFFGPTGNWSEMVADEKDNGPADLPVIDFTDFNGRPPSQNIPARKSKKVSKPKPVSGPPPTSTPALDETIPSAEEVVSEPTNPPSQLSKGQSARQAYQHKLETDPSFVPTIGNFWGHDDRLIDTELRSLSGWWRGRGRGRGRGFPLRGRGGFQGPHTRGAEDGTSPQEDLPPIERAWTHDGFEDMKRKEEQRRAEQLAARNDASSPKRGGFNSPRGGFIPGRGRGGSMRGGFVSQMKPRTTSPFAHSARVRFVMKPELMWTKQHEAFLYFDPTLKPKSGHGAGYRVKLPGEQTHIVRAGPASRAPHTSKAKFEGSDAGEKYFVVRLPQRAGKERAVVVDEQISVKEVIAVKLQPEPSALLEEKTAPIAVDILVQPLPLSETPTKALPRSSVQSQLERLTVDPQPSDPERLAKTEQAVLRQSTTDATSEPRVPEDSSSSERPILPPLQTTFTPPPPPPPQPILQPSPAYGSPYGYHHALPAGVAMNHHGMPYEVATGRPVYFPPPVYNPRPIIPNHYNAGVFVPGHMHHSSAVSPDFLAQPPSHTPPVNGFIDPATGTPIFSFPRQTSRIEIRAPTAEDSGKSGKTTPRTSSGLPTTAPTFQPSRSTSTETGYYQPVGSEASISSYENTNGQPMEEASQVGMAGMMAYPAYQHPYYYPEPYGYPQYMDMSQAGQYDMYNMDQTPQGTVYY